MKKSVVPRSLKSKLLLGVFALVIGSGLAIASLVMQRYAKSIYEGMNAQAENLAHEIALACTDKILTGDLVALRKALNAHMESNPAISYIFISRGGQVLADTFDKGVPVELMRANVLSPGSPFRFQKIISTTGQHYLDVAWPILDKQAGLLRLGLSEGPYRKKVVRLWFQISGLTFAILLSGLAGTLFFLGKITRPLSALARAAREIDRGNFGVRVKVDTQDELADLAASFNHMAESIEDYTQRLEEQTMELERAHNQTRTFCKIVQKIGSMHSIEGIGSFLMNRFQQILKCDQLAFLVFNTTRDHLLVMSKEGVQTLREPRTLYEVETALTGIKEMSFTKAGIFKRPFFPEEFQAKHRKALIPLQYENNHLFGALLIGCPEGCRCNKEDFDMVRLILDQSAGVLGRVLVQEEELRNLRRRFEIKAGYKGILGKDPKMQTIYKLIEDIAPTDATILIQGESGTGKELVAQAIHNQSQRRNAPFVVINCSAYPETLLESELFGHEKGAFTGAFRQRQGRFEQANGGTVFLDEIGEIPLTAQVKLLRVIQNQKFERVGGNQTLSVDVRILAASNKDLLAEVQRGNFREDLFYRLNVVPVSLPALRNRRNDIPLLANHFLRGFAEKQEKKITGISSEALRLLLDYPWPGNVRELENTMEHAALLCKGGQIQATDLPNHLFHPARPFETDRPQTMEENEKEFLKSALERCGWNKRMAARRLKISRNTLYLKMKKYQISDPTIQ